jgi:hypothetical protein
MKIIKIHLGGSNLLIESIKNKDSFAALTLSLHTECGFFVLTTLWCCLMGDYYKADVTFGKLYPLVMDISVSR